MIRHTKSCEISFVLYNSYTLIENMRRAFTILFFLIATSGSAQQARHTVLYELVQQERTGKPAADAPALFSQSKLQQTGLFTHLNQYTLLDLDRNAALDCHASAKRNIDLPVPVKGGGVMMLKLTRQTKGAAGFSFRVINAGRTVKRIADRSVHYRGYVEGDPSSIACISISSGGEVMGLFSTAEGNFNIGKIPGSNGKYIVYRDHDITQQPLIPCATNESFSIGHRDPAPPPDPSSTTPPSMICNKVRIYWEADYKLYSYNFSSSLSATQDYLSGLFNIVAAVYQNEGIRIELSETAIWTSADPYSSTSSLNGLSGFKSRWNGMGDAFNGDVAMLVAGGNISNGGIAYQLDGAMCQRSYAYGYANVKGNYLQLPAYSWDVEVLSHETGHNLGSHHTQWCGWNTGPGGSCGAIDNCFSLEASTGCSTCPVTTDVSTAPSGFKGTIMSYCHLVNGVGINLALGFGPLPQAAIRNNVSSTACLTSNNTWTGATGTAWEDPSNWSCNDIPNSLSDVLIPSGLTNYPEVNSAGKCRSISQSPNTSVIVKSGHTLNVSGHH